MKWTEISLTVFRGESAALKDGSVRLIRYIVPAGAGESLIMDKSKYTPNTYTLTVCIPGQRSVDAVINIVKSSANTYKLTYSDAVRTEMKAFDNYSQINTYLSGISPKG